MTVVGLVLVCHSTKLAEGAAELARQVAAEGLRVAVAGGLEHAEAGHGADATLGTDATLVLRAIGEAWSEDGVLVLMDLGSAVLSAELALDLLPEERRARVLLAPAPFVEGAVAAAVAASLGDPLERVAEEAGAALAAKAAHLAPPPGAEPPVGTAAAETRLPYSRRRDTPGRSLRPRRRRRRDAPGG